jgi:y4mF family transcriptional regulator
MNQIENQSIKGTQQLGEIIQGQRKLLKLTQQELSGVAGVGPRFISDLENGKPTVEFEKVLQVLASLGLELRLQKRGWK